MKMDGIPAECKDFHTALLSAMAFQVFVLLGALVLGIYDSMYRVEYLREEVEWASFLARGRSDSKYDELV
eukprot:CAMPEP_0181333808 /NCGR_PEP_ID=MMETSP1101-20121128/25892_1 /TAXON_ID=46948 /ORGANISM="Rhodomonas abbreviata, Strain Caron Lab Isolate" /LENGTH=69 /DNA_ID=CAMNT_0023443679 /DNA_START=441 /DNA_END=650 /DNA_ORIENTATION=+